MTYSANLDGGEAEEESNGLETASATLGATGMTWDITENGVIGAQRLANALSGTSSPIINIGKLPLVKIGNLGTLSGELAGNILGGVGMVLTAYDIKEKGLNWSNGTDLVMGAVAFIPVIGWAIAGGYFITNALLTANGGLSIGQRIGNAVGTPSAQATLNSMPITPNF